MTPERAQVLVILGTLWTLGVLWMLHAAQRSERERADLYRRLRGTR